MPTDQHLALRYFAGVDPQAVALVQVAVGTLLALPSLAFLRIEGTPPASAVAALVALGVGGTGLAYFPSTRSSPAPVRGTPWP